MFEFIVALQLALQLALLISIFIRWLAGGKDSSPPSDQRASVVYQACRHASALQFACSLGDVEGVRMIRKTLAGNDDVLEAVRSRAGPALAAAAGKNHRLLRLLCEEFALGAKHLCFDGYRALQVACRSGNHMTVRFLLGEGFTETPPEKFRETVLSGGEDSLLGLACAGGEAQVLDALFAMAGLGPETLELEQVRTAVGLACRHRRTDILMYLEDKRVLTRELFADRSFDPGCWYRPGPLVWRVVFTPRLNGVMIGLPRSMLTWSFMASYDGIVNNDLGAAKYLIKFLDSDTIRAERSNFMNHLSELLRTNDEGRLYNELYKYIESLRDDPVA